LLLRFFYAFGLRSRRLVLSFLPCAVKTGEGRRFKSGPRYQIRKPW